MPSGTELSFSKILQIARPINDISMEFEIPPNFAVLWLKMYSTDPNEILYTSRQYNWHDVWEMSLWSVEDTLN